MKKNRETELITTKKIRLSNVDSSTREFIDRKVYDYNGCYRSLYNNMELCCDKGFTDSLMERFSLTQIEFRSCLSDAKASAEQDLKNDEKMRDRIEELEYKLDSSILTDKDIAIYKNAIRVLSERLGRKKCFGGINLKREIDRLENRKDGSEKDIERLMRMRSEWFERRVRPLSVTGESNQCGNRFLDVRNIHKGYVIYKPSAKERHTLKLQLDRRLRKDLRKVAEMAANKEISVSFSLNRKFLCISYDVEILNGTGVDERSRRAEVKEVKSRKYPEETEKRLIHDIYIKYYDEQRERKLMEKIATRGISVDLNPGYIGWSVLDKGENGEAKVIKVGVIDMSSYNVKLGKGSSSPEQKRLNNKRKYELSVAIKKLFDIANHYRCGYFFAENLEINDKKLSREANRKTRNLWNRELTFNLIKRRCDENSMFFEEVNPCYTSFVGNIRYGFGDPANAAVEIGRRGLWKYSKEYFYPIIREEDEASLRRKFGDVGVGRFDMGWARIYKNLRAIVDSKTFAQILRDKVSDLNPSIYFVGRLYSIKSRVKMVYFY